MEKSARLKVLRILNGYTQEALAALAGTTQASLTLWEKGTYGPKPSVVPALASVLGVEPGYLSYGSPVVGPAVWVPVPPGRAQHVATMLRDIEALMPQFITENRLDSVASCELADGMCNLVGRGGRYDCLLLVDQRLVEGFVEAFKAQELDVVSCSLRLCEMSRSRRLGRALL